MKLKGDEEAVEILKMYEDDLEKVRRLYISLRMIDVRIIY